MKHFFLYALFALLAPSAQAELPPEFNSLYCKLYNLGGTAEFFVDGASNSMVTPSGGVEVTRAEVAQYGSLVGVSMSYRSNLLRNQVVDFLVMLAPSGAGRHEGETTYRGALWAPIYIPGLLPPSPFSGMPLGWNNPFGGLTPTKIPLGFLPWAVAECNLRQGHR